MVAATNGLSRESGPAVFVLDNRREVVGALRELLSPAGFSVYGHQEAQDPVVEAGEAQLVVLGEEGEESEVLIARLRAESPSLAPLLLLLGPGYQDAELRCRELGADSFLVAPLKRDATLAVCQDLLRIRNLLDQIEGLEQELDQLRVGAAPAKAGGEARDTEPSSEPVLDFEMFKRFLLMEIKRSRRYAYPISLALVALDDFYSLTEGWDPIDRGRAVGVALSRVTQGVRDIDLPVLYSEERMLVLMPHTPREGALIVGERLRNVVSRSALLLDGEERIRLTASVGIAAFGGRGACSFAELIRDATLALRSAQDQGGDRVGALGTSKRSRVSIG